MSSEQKITGQILMVFLTAALLALIFSILSAGIFQLYSMNRILPGIKVAGINVGGLTPNEAKLELYHALPYQQNGTILYTTGDQSFSFTPIQLGLVLDVDQSIDRVFQIGHESDLLLRVESWISTLLSPSVFNPVYVFNQQYAYEALWQVKQSLDRPVIEPSLKLENQQVQVSQGESGASMDIDLALAPLESIFTNQIDQSIPLIVNIDQPSIVNWEQQAQTANTILQEPLTISMPNGESELGPWSFDVETLASMLKFELENKPDSTQYELVFNTQYLSDFLKSLAPALTTEPRNPRFMFNDDTRLIEVVEPSISGQELDVNATLTAIEEALFSGGHQTQLVMRVIEPEVTDNMSGEELGITELVHMETSYFYGSSAERVQNITAASNEFYGLLIAPGETFSMASAMGDISLDNGYAEALIIQGGQTIKGIGGGVCQVSTTLFRAVFFAGFPIVERHSHAYRVSYYEKIAGNIRDNNLAGLDATVYVPIVDFKFTNDTDHWLLMETYVNPTYSSLVWKFYSTSDGRSVEWETTGPINIVEAPDPLYRLNEELEEGEIKKVDYEADGADVSVNRWVYKDGALYFQDVTNTHYEPWQAVYEYGAGTELPEDEDIIIEE